MRIVWIMTFLAPMLFGYGVGDKVPPSVQKSMAFPDGKIIIVDFFASWCHACEKELVLLEKMPLDASNVIMIGVDIDKDVSKGKAFQKKLSLSFHVINDNQQTLVKAFNPIAMPALYIIKDNQIQMIITGARDNIDHVIQKALQHLP